jgi:hypothetical protein
MKALILVLAAWLLWAVVATPWRNAPIDGKTETCVEHRQWLMSKKYLCTPAEAEAQRKKSGGR